MSLIAIGHFDKERPLFDKRESNMYREVDERSGKSVEKL